MGNIRKYFKGKKASLLDILFAAMIMCVVAVIILVAFKVNDEINTEIQAKTDIPSIAKASSNTMNEFFPGVVDNTFLFIVVGLAVVSIILAALVRIHPIFIPFFFFAWVMVIFFAGIFSNIYTTMAAEPEFLGLAEQLVKTSAILNFLPLFVGIFGILLMVVMYKNWQVAQ